MTVRRSLEDRVGLLAGAVLAVLTSGVAGALVLDAGRPPATAAQADAAERVVTAAYTVAAVPVNLELVQPPAPPVPAPAAAPGAPAPATAPAPADPLCSGAGWQQRRGAAALTSLRRPADAALFDLSFEPGRAGVIGLATVHERRLQVFVRPCSELSDRLLRHVVAHELGHLVDGARLTDDLRSQWLAVRGLDPATPWYGCNTCTDFGTPAGDFAEVYAQWQTGASTNRSELSGSPARSELEALAARFF